MAHLSLPFVDNGVFSPLPLCKALRPQKQQRLLREVSAINVKIKIVVVTARGGGRVHVKLFLSWLQSFQYLSFDSACGFVPSQLRFPLLAFRSWLWSQNGTGTVAAAEYCKLSPQCIWDPAKPGHPKQRPSLLYTKIICSELALGASMSCRRSPAEAHLCRRLLRLKMPSRFCRMQKLEKRPLTLRCCCAPTQ